MMVAENTRNMYSNFAVNNKDDCLKLHHVGYLINRMVMHGTTNIKSRDLSLSNCLRVGMGGTVTVMKLNKCFSVKVFNTTSNVPFTCCVIRRQCLVATNLEPQASENLSHVIGLLIFYELSTLKGRIIFYFSMAQNVLTFF
jgi:hypothetical protein